MMYSPFILKGGHGIFPLLHGLFHFFAVIGVLLLVAWAIKHLPAQKLKEVGLWLFAVGVVGALLLTALTISARMEFGDNGVELGLMKQGMMRSRMMQQGGMMWGNDR
ncbi:hypothetical protein HYW84_03030 [Candidatus Peregrinibacteria bacterium]|nr:hypothetical protein [Candidatus Peregrinibacteria bacterium]